MLTIMFGYVPKWFFKKRWRTHSLFPAPHFGGLEFAVEGLLVFSEFL